MFNGNRITLAKSYYLKGQGLGELPLSQPKEQQKAVGGPAGSLAAMGEG